MRTRCLNTYLHEQTYILTYLDPLCCSRKAYDKLEIPLLYAHSGEGYHTVDSAWVLSFSFWSPFVTTLYIILPNGANEVTHTLNGQDRLCWLYTSPKKSGKIQNTSTNQNDDRELFPFIHSLFTHCSGVNFPLSTNSTFILPDSRDLKTPHFVLFLFFSGAMDKNNLLLVFTRCMCGVWRVLLFSFVFVPWSGPVLVTVFSLQYKIAQQNMRLTVVSCSISFV